MKSNRHALCSYSAHNLAGEVDAHMDDSNTKQITEEPNMMGNGTLTLTEGIRKDRSEEAEAL